MFNPNKDNEYTFRFTPEALATTIPYYAQRLLFFRYSGFLLLPLALIRDRRVWFGLIATFCFLFTLLFLPGRIFEAYAYLPFACATIALAAAATRLNPHWPADRDDSLAALEHPPPASRAQRKTRTRR